jgi:hypothetical protein
LDILANWWNNNFGGDDPKKMHAIASSKNSSINSLTIPLLAKDRSEKLVGTGKQLLYLGWIGKDNQSYTVTVKRENQWCLIDENCWKTTISSGTSTSIEVNLENGQYEVTVKAGSLEGTGSFSVIDSHSDMKEQQKDWAIEQLVNNGTWKF